jgi:hypothetical protein
VLYPSDFPIAVINSPVINSPILSFVCDDLEIVNEVQHPGREDEDIETIGNISVVIFNLLEFRAKWAEPRILHA